MPACKILPSLRRLTLVAALVLGLLLSATRTALAGEVIYKSLAANGEISYSWRPDPSAVRTETVAIDALTPEQRRAYARFRQEEAKAEHDANAYATGLDKKWTHVEDEMKGAQNGLNNAEAALQAGREPLPGERRSNKGGGNRLMQAYFDRLQNLELDVEKAKQRLDRAYSAWNVLR